MYRYNMIYSNNYNNNNTSMNNYNSKNDNFNNNNNNSNINKDNNNNNKNNYCTCGNITRNHCLCLCGWTVRISRNRWEWPGSADLTFEVTCAAMRSTWRRPSLGWWANARAPRLAKFLETQPPWLNGRCWKEFFLLKGDRVVGFLKKANAV